MFISFQTKISHHITFHFEGNFLENKKINNLARNTLGVLVRDYGMIYHLAYIQLRHILIYSSKYQRLGDRPHIKKFRHNWKKNETSLD